VEAAEADIEAGYADYRNILVSLSAELALAYIDLRTLQARLDRVHENIALQEKTLKLAETRHASGVGTALEVARTKRLLQSTLARVPELKRGAVTAENRINVLLGLRPGETQFQSGSIPAVPELIGIGIPVDLMTRRPDIAAAALRYRAAVARTGAAEADKYPRLSLSGTLSLQSDSLNGLIDPDSLIYSLGPDLHFPLFTGGRIESRIEQRASRAEQARLALSQKIIEALSEVETAATGVVRTQEQVREFRLAEASALKIVDLADSLFRSGLGDMFQVLDAEKQLVSIQESLLLARQRSLAEVVYLYRALGGGWEKEPVNGER
jgi:NodT family efflux transporter outer membrane factor (OMF) lipoprotein